MEKIIGIMQEKLEKFTFCPRRHGAVLILPCPQSFRLQKAGYQCFLLSCYRILKKAGGFFFVNFVILGNCRNNMYRFKNFPPVFFSTSGHGALLIMPYPQNFRLQKAQYQSFLLRYRLFQYCMNINLNLSPDFAYPPCIIQTNSWSKNIFFCNKLYQ